MFGGRYDTKLNQYRKEMEKKGFNITITKNIPFMTQHCNVLVTTTASETPIIKAEAIHPGTHITAVEADAPNKSELDPALIEKCDVLVVDSKEQCIHHGEISHAYKKGLIAKEKLLELGEVIHNPALGRSHAEQITMADLTGIAVQDIQIVKAIIN
jgi:ornithine cyclodeaminase